MDSSPPANAAIAYHEDGFEPGATPMGRRMAGLGMLRGYVEHAAVDAFYGHGQADKDRVGFEAAVRRFGGAAPVRWSHPLDNRALTQAGALHLSGPMADVHGFYRRAVGQRAWSLTGVTHTVSTHRAMEAIASIMTGPLQSWDALICTSRAVRSVVEGILAAQGDYLRDRLGAPAPSANLQLPVIPLGVRCQDFAAAPAARQALRARLGVPEDAILVLFAARLSYHSKAHPHPMYMALQEAATRTGAKVHLLLTSWFAKENHEPVFRDGAAELCPDVVLHILDGTQPGVWDQVWQAGDIYTLLSDNIQESFGLSPVEAMAAGLPVVGSDWNGLKDTIVHGETGFLAPTLAPPPGYGFFMSQGYDFGQFDYDNYIGATAQVVSVDVAAAADAFAALIADAGLRKSMGEAGRARALSLYDWSRVIPQYQALWADLAARRKVDREVAPLRKGHAGHPARGDPFRTFAAYPTRAAALTDRVVAGPGLEPAAAALSRRKGASTMAGVVLAAPEVADLARTLSALRETTIGDLIRSMPDQSGWRVLRTVTWLHKHGLVAIRAAPAGQA